MAFAVQWACNWLEERSAFPFKKRSALPCRSSKTMSKDKHDGSSSADPDPSKDEEKKPSSGDEGTGVTNGSKLPPSADDGALADALNDLFGGAEENDEPTSFDGSVTELIHRLGDSNDPHAEDDFWCAVIDQLTLKARAVLRTLHVAHIEPEELVNDVFHTLRRVLAKYDVRDRQHFYAIACKNFRWKVLEILNGLVARAPLPPDIELRDQSTGAKARLCARLTSCIDSLDGELQQIVQMHAVLGMSYRKIGEELGLPFTTVHIRYVRAVEVLRRRLRDCD
jgi:RNA polymerase sigma factor (sigma-70 family)